jgi:hypothetical protein
MVIKNYTTKISVEKTMMEIEKILSKYGATHIFKMYENGVPIALAFKCEVGNQSIPFKLPMEANKIMVVFKQAVKKGELPKRYFEDREQARRTGWRIIKDWVDSQMALITINVAKFEEIFLPYMYDEVNNQTLFQKMENNNFNMQLGYDK